MHVPCEGIHSRNVAYEFVLISPASLAHLIWIVLEIGCRWPYSCCFVGCCSLGFVQYQLVAFSVQFSSSFYCVCFITIIILSCHPARISLTPLSATLPISFIASGSSPQGYIPNPHWAAVCRLQASRFAFARPCEGVHRGTSLMSSPCFPQQCPACVVRLTFDSFRDVR